jgi:hypothetical protein
MGRGALVRWVLFAERAWGEPFGAVLLRGWIVLLVATLANTACQAAGMYDRLEVPDLDRLHRSSLPGSARGDPITLVLITDEDYETFFENTSPLAANGVLQLVEAVCRFQPRVVGVDILTADIQWTEAIKELPDSVRSCPLVWIRDSLQTREEFVVAGGGDDASLAVERGKVLGAFDPPGTCAAIAVVRPDADGTIREYQTHYPVLPAGATMPKAEPTFITRVARAGDGVRPCSDDGSLPRRSRTSHRMTFSANDQFNRLNAGWLLGAAASKDATRFQAFQRLITPATSVIIGGGYRAARDRHRTPIGQLFGSEILANAVFAERHGLRIRDDTAWLVSFGVDIAVGTVLLAFVTWTQLRWLWALLLSSGLAVVAAFAVSWLLFNYVGYFLGVFGAMAGVIVGTVVEIVWDPLTQQWREWKVEFKERLHDVLRGDP